MTTHNLPTYMRIGPFSKEFGIGRSKTYDLIGDGKLRAKKVGKCTLVETASGIEYMNSMPDAMISPSKKAEAVAGAR